MVPPERESYSSARARAQCQMQLSRGWVEIDLDAIVRNATRDGGAHAAHPPNGEGGCVRPGRRARGARARAALAVGIRRRDGRGGARASRRGNRAPIIVFTPVDVDELAAVRDAQLTPALASAPIDRALDEHRRRRVASRDRHRDVALGRSVGRGGVACHACFAAHPPEGVFTHFHSATLDDDSIAEQESAVRASARAVALRDLPCSTRRTRGAMARRERSRWHVGRPGVFLYGVGVGAAPVVHPSRWSRCGRASSSFERCVPAKA